MDFNQILITAALTNAHHDGIIINQLKKAVHEDVYRGVMQSVPVPTTYKAWVEKAKEVDVIEETIRKNRAEQLASQPCPCLHIPQGPLHLPQAPPPPCPQAFVPRDHQGIKPGTHPGRGIPMDVDINMLCQRGLC